MKKTLEDICVMRKEIRILVRTSLHDYHHYFAAHALADCHDVMLFDCAITKRFCRCQEHHRVAFEVFKLKGNMKSSHFSARFCEAWRVTTNYEKQHLSFCINTLRSPMLFTLYMYWCTTRLFESNSNYVFHLIRLFSKASCKLTWASPCRVVTPGWVCETNQNDAFLNVFNVLIESLSLVTANMYFFSVHESIIVRQVGRVIDVWWTTTTVDCEQTIIIKGKLRFYIIYFVLFSVLPIFLQFIISGL